MKKLLVLLSVFLVLVLAACGRPATNVSKGDNGEEDQEVFTIRIAYLVSEEQSSHLAAKTFQEKLEKESDGRFKVELYPNGQLYASDREAIEAVQLGNVEMTIPAVAPLASFNKKFMVFDLPFLFEDNEAAYRALDGELGEQLLAELDNNDMKGLVFAENGFRHMSNNNGPIQGVEDLAGLKYRTLENPVHTDTFKAFGANASPFAFGELYTALQQKTYDAMESPISLYYTNKFYEVQDYLTITSHVYAATILLMNNDFYNRLPADLQELVVEGLEGIVRNSVKLRKNKMEFLNNLKEEGMQVNELTADQRNEFREAVKTVYDKYVPEIGEDLVKMAQDANNQ